MSGYGDELKRLPVLRLLMPLIMGVVIQYNTRISPLYITPLAILLFLALCLLARYRPVIRQPCNKWYYGLTLYLFVSIVSMGLTENRLQASSFMDIPGSNAFVLSRVVENPQERERSFRILIDPVAVISDDSFRKTSGRAIAWFEKDTAAAQLTAGEYIIMPHNFREISNAGNPWEFDYRRHTMFQGIYGEIYLRADAWFKPGMKTGVSGITVFPVKLRYRLLDILAESGIAGRDFTVASALLLGYRNTLDYETRRIYSGSGAMHILAVSGLHVGILYLLLVWMLGFLRDTRYYSITAAVIIVAVIWFYAALTGLSPSVTRSATMFTFLTVSRSLGRPVSTLNTLASAAVFQLIADPLSLFMVGFQLSYLAVAGIVCYQPAIYSLLRFKNYIPDRIWALVSLSLSAQLLIFPLIIYYFNHFPGYFPVTNIFAVPLAMIILYSGFFLFLISWLEPVAVIFAVILNGALKVLNFILTFISNLPFAMISDIHAGPALVVSLYGIIVLTTLFFKNKKAVFLFLALLTIISGLGLRADYRIRTANQNIFIVYNSRGASIYNFITGNHNFLISSIPDHSVAAGPPLIASGPARHLNARNSSIIPADDFSSTTLLSDPVLYTEGDRLVFFAGQTIWFPGGEMEGFNELAKPLEIDILVASSRTTADMAALLNLIRPSLVVIDSSVSRFQRELIVDQCNNAGICFWDVVSSGAFVARLEK
jgi:competence protein ComEC